MSDTWTPLPADRLMQAVEEADLRVLLMVIFHLTGDRRWFSDPYLPKRDVNLIADEDAGLSEEARAEIRAKVVELLSSPDLAPAVDDPGDELMVEMMSRCLGEAVPPESALMMREEMGLCSRQVDWRDEKPTHVRGHLPVVIVGAGASGIALAANLEKLGVSYTILEKNNEVGGTWYENTYPGCGVDTPNHAYSFSFGNRYRWSRYFAPRDELQDYLVRSADEAGIRAKTRFTTRVVKTDWDEAACCWRVLAEGPRGSEEIQAMAVVSAIGQLSLPSVPHIEGADTFDGPIFHTAEWPDGLDLAGKRVAIIGTGASSMQIVPSVVDKVASFTVYQRNAQWARPIPRYHDPIGDGA